MPLYFDHDIQIVDALYSSSSVLALFSWYPSLVIINASANSLLEDNYIWSIAASAAIMVAVSSTLTTPDTWSVGPPKNLCTGDTVNTTGSPARTTTSDPAISSLTNLVTKLQHDLKQTRKELQEAQLKQAERAKQDVIQQKNPCTGDSVLSTESMTNQSSSYMSVEAIVSLHT